MKILRPGLLIRIDLMRIPIQHFSSLRIQILFRIQYFHDQNWKITAVKLLFIFFGSKMAIYLSLDLHKGCTSYRRSLQPSKENIQHFKTWKFFTFFHICGSFLPSGIRVRIRIQNADPEPATQINADWLRLVYTDQFGCFIQVSLKILFAIRFYMLRPTWGIKFLCELALNVFQIL